LEFSQRVLYMTSQKQAAPTAAIDYAMALSRPPLDYPSICYDELLTRTSNTHGSRTAIIHKDVLISYAALETVTNAVARVLSDDLSIGKGDVVALAITLSPETIILYMAVLRIGGIVTPINPLHIDEAELEHQLASCNAVAALVTPAVYMKLTKMEQLPSTLRHRLWFGFDAELPASQNILFAAEGKSSSSFRPNSHTPDDLAVISFTSGTTTGLRKGALLTHRNIVCNAFQFANAQCLSDKDIILNALPGLAPMHMGGTIAVGATHVMAHRQDSHHVLELARRYHVTQIYAAAPMIAALDLIDDLEIWRNPWLMSITGAANKLNPELMKRVGEKLNVAIVQGFGMQEAAPVTHASPSFYGFLPPPGSCGLPVANTEQRIISIDTGEPLGRGPHNIGQLCIKGPQVMRGYLKNPELTAAVLQEGWYLTGDLAWIDHEGYLHYVDRLIDAVRYEGGFVAAAQIEEVLKKHPAISECAVVAPTGTSGEIYVFACIREILTSLETVSLRDEIHRLLPVGIAVRHVEVVPKLPRCGLGKLLRRVLRSQVMNLPRQNTETVEAA
jgi:long-chain acyl-CoA synthetase